ncbi:MAG: Asp23/Gls24 family envelope stress response protein [Defluviitaleaceae bacterium]|nr:Asp23/Gls24 family envelope stress response protein [Defluviitaleaceae bacterium]
MIEIKTGAGAGQVQIADEVIATIAGTAALEIDGVAGMGGGIVGGISDMLGRKNLAKGVAVTVNGADAVIDLFIVVKFGNKIQEISTEVQKRVKVAVETMTGLNVPEVRVTVSGVVTGKDRVKPGEAEL